MIQLQIIMKNRSITANNCSRFSFLILSCPTMLADDNSQKILMILHIDLGTVNNNITRHGDHSPLKKKRVFRNQGRYEVFLACFRFIT